VDDVRIDVYVNSLIVRVLAWSVAKN